MSSTSLTPKDSPVWVSIADLAREYSKTVQTMHNWAKSGFLHELGYRTRQDETGHWFVAKTSRT